MHGRRLLPTQIQDIRLKWLSGATLRELASEYKCSHMTIKRVVNFDTFKDVEIPRADVLSALGLTGPSPFAGDRAARLQ